MKSGNSFKTLKKQTVSKISTKQFNAADQRARRLYKLNCEQKNVCLILDDETYVKTAIYTLPGDSFYSVQDRDYINYSENHIGIEKFGEKMLVWR